VRLFETFYFSNEKMVHLKSHKTTYCRILENIFLRGLMASLRWPGK
jgi:hypothetical protein